MMTMYRSCVLFVALLACGTDRPKHVGASKSAKTSVETISGRVTANGRAVKHFGISLWRVHDVFEGFEGRIRTDADIRVFEEPLSIRDVDGRFVVSASPGKWRVVVSGLNFARSVSPIVAIGRGGSASLDIKVSSSRVIVGAVRDTDGNPVANAFVRILQDSYRANVLWDAANGNYLAITDENGAFRINGFARLTREPIAAEAITTADNYPSGKILLAAEPVVVPDGQPKTTIEFVLRKVGGIRGEISPATRADMLAIVRSVTDPTVNERKVPVSNGIFVVDRIPIGEYKIALWAFTEGKHLSFSHRVIVREGEVTFALFTSP